MNIPGILRLPKQYPAVAATTFPPLPAPCTSLIRPPVPVVAPEKGATPKTIVHMNNIIIMKLNTGNCRNNNNS